MRAVFTFTPQAAQKLNAIMQERGGHLAVKIEIDSSGSGEVWRMTLVRRSAATAVVSGVPVQVDAGTAQLLDGLIIDWVMTPDGPGLGVYDQNLLDEVKPRRRS